jgi:GT2 family glycosyltransferase
MSKDLSVIIVSYNTASLTFYCIDRLFSSLEKEKNISYEVIVVDNGSKDDTIKRLKKISFKKPNLLIIQNKKNLGYAKANNLGVKKASGKFILFLNSDVLISDINWNNLLKFFKKNEKIGALTVRVNLKNNTIDPACHRGLPTLWRSFCYFFRLEKIFASFPFLNRLFGGYHLVYLDLEKIHEVEAISGAFFLTKKKILERLKGFDEDFFMYGEDLDLCLRIRKLGYKIVYYPLFSVLHLKYQSGLRKEDKEIKRKTNYYFYQAMKIFYQKHYEKKYPFFVNLLVYLFLDIKLRLYEKNRY